MRRRRRSKRKGRLLILFFLLIASLIWADRQFSPIIISQAEQELHQAAVRALQNSVRDELLLHQEYQDYNELMHIEKDNSDRIVLLAPNTMKLNMLVSSITANAEIAMDRLSTDSISIPLGAVSGSKLFSSLGPDFNVDVTPVSTVDVSIIDDFVDAGINQTRHRIWLHLKVNLGLSVPLEENIITAETDVLLCEGIIVGPIPDTYLDLGNSFGISQPQ